MYEIAVQKKVKMVLKPITNSKEHQYLLDWIDGQFDADVQKGTPDGNLLKVALILVKDYEDKFFPVPIPQKNRSPN